MKHADDQIFLYPCSGMFYSTYVRFMMEPFAFSSPFFKGMFFASPRTDYSVQIIRGKDAVWII
jgi:hypothetical protein